MRGPLRRQDPCGQEIMATVTLKKLKKVYEGGFEAVHAFDLDIADKEFIVLVGPSGCGKSTTLRMIAGLEEITDGELRIGDRLVNDVEPKDRDIAMVFQSYALYPHMTVYDNMAFGLKLRKVPKAEIDKKVMEAAKILEITELLDRKPKALSGGQRQRVAIGRAIVREPKVFLMDEPLSNLDAKLRNSMRAEIIKLRKRIDTTFIYVTHDQVEAMTLGDRIVIMKDGWVMQVGTPQEVYNHPANLFVATFIGAPQMNLLNAKLVKSGSDYNVEVAGAAIAVPAESAAKLAADGVDTKDILLGIRPMHIQLKDEGADVIKSTVDVSEMMGAELQLHVEVAGKDVIICVQTAELPVEKRAGIATGTPIGFTFRGDLMHLFDPETEQSLLYR